MHVDLFVDILQIDVNGDIGIGDVALQNTVAAVDRAISDKVNDSIAAAQLVGCGRTFLDQIAGRRSEKPDSFAVADRIINTAGSWRRSCLDDKGYVLRFFQDSLGHGVPADVRMNHYKPWFK